MTLTLPKKLERFVQERLERGEYTDENAVLEEALEFMRDFYDLAPRSLEELRAFVDAGILDANERPTSPLSSVTSHEIEALARSRS